MTAGEADTGDASAGKVDVDAANADEADADEGSHEKPFLPLVLSGLFAVAVGFVVLASLLGRTTYLAGYSLRLRLVALGFLPVELLIPLGVYLDLRRRSDDPDFAWVHAVSMPVVNVLGLVAYLEERKRNLE